MKTDISQRLLQFLNQRQMQDRLLNVGEVRLVNIEDVKKEAGEDWPQFRQRIMIAAESIIEKRLAQDDFVIPCSDGFVIILKFVEEAEANRLCALISRDLKKFFLGERPVARVRTRVEIETVYKSDLLNILAGRSTHRLSDRLNESAVRDALMADNIEGNPDRATEAKAVFTPVWDVRNKLVSTYFVTPKMIFLSGVDVYGYAATDFENGAELLNWNLTVLQKAVDGATGLLRDGGKCTVAFGVNFKTLSDPVTLEPYVGALAESATPDLRRHLLIKIDDVPPETDPEGLKHAIYSVKSVCDRVLVQVPFGTTNLSEYRDCGAIGFGCSLPPEIRNAGPLSVNKAIVYLSRLSTIARSIKCKTYVELIHSPSFLRRAGDVGVSFATGPVIGLPLQRPLTTVPLQWETIARNWAARRTRLVQRVA